MKNKDLTIFFILLTISIGLVSVNLPLSSSYAQNSALSQSGNSGDAEQEIGSSQSSTQNGQVVSGDNSVLSGNNLLCQDQANSDELSILNDQCKTAVPVGLGPPSKLLIKMLVDNSVGCKNRGGVTDVITLVRTEPRLFTSLIHANTLEINEVIERTPPYFLIDFVNQTDCLQPIVTVRESSGPEINCKPSVLADCSVRMPDSSFPIEQNVVLDIKFTNTP